MLRYLLQLQSGKKSNSYISFYVNYYSYDMQVIPFDFRGEVRILYITYYTHFSLSWGGENFSGDMSNEVISVKIFDL